MTNSMFCRQCEQTQNSKACLNQGVCGKSAETARMQDLLVYALKGLAWHGHKARQAGIKDAEADRLIMEGLFTTVTNVNFDTAAIAPMIWKAVALRERAKTALAKSGKAAQGPVPPAASFSPAQDIAGLLDQSGEAALPADHKDEDIRALRETLLFGLKGMAAYADHAFILGKEDDGVNGFFYEGLSALTDDKLGAQDYLALIMRFGQANFKCLEILDAANTGAYGHPVPTQVPLGHKKGPAILVSGHDLRDLFELLEQTEGKGISLYTHGEMLPAHAYPKLKAFKHFYGHYGSAWQNQYKEFAEFPGALLMTTNCIQRPASSYTGRIFTTGLVQWPGVKHIERAAGKKDFAPVIEAALEAGGFSEDAPGKEITIGFARNTVLGAAETVVKLVKAGKIKHFFLIGGCDGAKPGRNYYTDFARKVPKDCLILTLACGKFRFNTLEFGELEGLPRLLDCGQCNDAYSAIVIALALAKAFNCTVNELPLSLILSWYEQKAVCILLTLLSLGVKNIRLGPTLPAFVSPNILKALVENFGLKPVTTPDKDIADILGVAAK
ncbi:MAG: hydroxylamine reductase [Elusimicrobiales bacterium]|nr:hydroxylamine reductase [Elusimicrobiales bacterium]